jgi:hypothetical protein
MTGDLEKESPDRTLDHLTEDEMAAYCEQQVEGTRRARIEMHLKGCFICRRRLELLEEESRDNRRRRWRRKERARGLGNRASRGKKAPPAAGASI